MASSWATAPAQRRPSTKRARHAPASTLDRLRRACGARAWLRAREAAGRAQERGPGERRTAMAARRTGALPGPSAAASACEAAAVTSACRLAARPSMPVPERPSPAGASSLRPATARRRLCSRCSGMDERARQHARRARLPARSSTAAASKRSSASCARHVSRAPAGAASVARSSHGSRPRSSASSPTSAAAWSAPAGGPPPSACGQGRRWAALDARAGRARAASAVRGCAPGGRRGAGPRAGPRRPRCCR